MKDLSVKKELSIELGRKTVHFFIVLVNLLLFHLFEYNLVPFLVVLLIFGIAISEITIRGHEIPIVSWAIKNFDRPENTVFRPGLGVFTLITGILITILLSKFLVVSKTFTEVAILMAASDTFSTVLGLMFGKTRWGWNFRKTVEGSFAFLIFSIFVTSGYLDGFSRLIVPLVATLVETIPKMDDNFAIPTASLLTLKLIG
ncbi:MAG: hypothetical protein GOU98_01910 [Candidatus Altiarchaeota archaeon]|nr:hypothetical protein [Candidatus Altiarchaeota archaeon]